jgi:hypothetical protein
MKTRLFFTAVAFIAMTAMVSAQDTQQSTPQAGRGRAAGNAWVDADKNGVCDNYENGTRMGRRAYSAGENMTAANRGPGRGMGQGVLTGNGKGMGRNQAVTGGRGMGRAQGTAPGRGRFNGRGPAYVDANNNGICDNLEATAGEK